MVGDKFARVYSLYFNEILFCLVFKYFNIKVFYTVIINRCGLSNKHLLLALVIQIAVLENGLEISIALTNTNPTVWLLICKILG